MNHSNWRQLRDLLDANVLNHSDPLAYAMLRGELADREVIPNEARWLSEAYKQGIQAALENGVVSDGVFGRTAGRMFNAGHRKDVAHYAVQMWRRAIYCNHKIASSNKGTPAFAGRNRLHQYGTAGTQQNAPSRSRVWALVLVLLFAVASVWYTQSRCDYAIPITHQGAHKAPRQPELPLTNPPETTTHKDSSPSDEELAGGSTKNHPPAGIEPRSTSDLHAQDTSLRANQNSVPARGLEPAVSRKPKASSSTPAAVLMEISPPFYFALLSLDAVKLLERILLRGSAPHLLRESHPAVSVASAKPNPTAGVYLEEDLSARKLFRRAKLASTRGNHQQAVAGFTELLESGVVDTWVYHNRGSSRVFLHDYQGARADLDSAIELDSSNHLAFALRGLLKTVVDGDEAAGALDIQHAVVLDRNAPYTYYVRAICRRHVRTQEKLELAVLDCDKTIALCHKSKHPTWLLRDAHFVKGLANQELGKRSEAHAQFRQALVIDPTHARAQRGFQETRS